jgi:hypothetical protein
MISHPPALRHLSRERFFAGRIAPEPYALRLSSLQIYHIELHFETFSF